MMRPSTTRALVNAIVARETSQAGSSGATAAVTKKASPPRRSPRDIFSDFPRRRAREQPVRAKYKHERHHRIDHEKLELRKNVDRGGARESYDECAHERAFDRAHAAGRHHRKGEHDHLDTD